MNSSVTFMAPSVPFEVPVLDKKSKLEKLQTEINRKDKIIKVMGLAILGISGLGIAAMYKQNQFSDCSGELKAWLAAVNVLYYKKGCNAEQLEHLQDFFGNEEAASLCTIKKNNE